MKPIIRCSELDRILSCPGSRTLNAIVAQRQGDEGQEGTNLHARIAWMLVNVLGASQPEGGLKPNDGMLIKIPKYSEWIVDYCFRFVRDNYANDWAMEVELPLAYDMGRWILSGHQDVHAVNRDATACRGSDWKTGYKAVTPAEANEQVLGYLCLNKLAYPNLNYAAFDVIQPRLDDEEFPRVSTVELDGAQLDRCLSSLNDRVNAALDNPMQLETGMNQCAWCSAAVSCPAIISEIEHMKATLTPEFLAKLQKEPNDAALGDLVIAAKTIARPIDDAMDLIKERLEKNKAVLAGSGVTITAKESNGAFKILDHAGLYKAVREVIKDEDRLAKALSFPMGRLADAVAEEMDIPKTGKADVTAEKIAKAQFHPFAEQGRKITLQFSA